MQKEELFSIILSDEFFSINNFSVYRSDDDDFSVLGSSLRSKNGKEVTCGFFVYDDDPSVVELRVQIYSFSTIEQLKCIAETIAAHVKCPIGVYEEDDHNGFICKFDMEISNIGPLKMAFGDMLRAINNVICFTI